MDLALPLRPPKIQGLTFQPNLCPPQKCVFSELFGVLTRKTGIVRRKMESSWLLPKWHAGKKRQFCRRS